MAGQNSKNLVLFHDVLPRAASSQSIVNFTNLSDMNKYLCAHLTQADNFDIHLRETHFEDLLQVGIQDIAQVHLIYVYYENEEARQAGSNRFPAQSKEAQMFKFCLSRTLEGQLENAEIGSILPSSDSSVIWAKENVIASKEQRLCQKRMNTSNDDSSKSKRFIPTAKGLLRPILSGPCCKSLDLKLYQLNHKDEFPKSWLDNKFR